MMKRTQTARWALTLMVALLTALTAWATTASTINVGGTDYVLYTGFTATGGNGTNYSNLVDGNTSTSWIAQKSYNNGDPDAPAGDFNGGTEDPAYVEFHADAPIIPKGYVLTCDHENAGFWKPVKWSLKAKLNEGDAWTTIHSSNTTLGAGKTFEIPCTNDGNNQYQYFRFEIYDVGGTMVSRLNELQFYASMPAYTHLTVKAATCTATGIKVDCYLRNSDGKYFTDETGATELAESAVIEPMIPHSGEHHEATDVNIEYWQCSMCGKYFSDEGYTTEITEEQTKIYRTITIDGSISSLVTSNASQVLAGTTMYLYVSDLIDASTLKVNNGAVELTAVTDIQYAFTMPAADVTVTADIVQSNVDGDILTGSIRHTVTIADGANITLNNATISGSIVCEGSATITLVGTNSVTGAYNKAGIQVGGSGTTLTIRGDGSLTANGGDWSAGIGTGVIKNTNNDNSTSVQFGNVTIKGGSVTATGGDSGDGIGKGYSYYGPTITFGTVTIYDGIDKVDASSIKNSGSIVYKHDETDVTASKSDYFTIIANGNRLIIVQKVTPAIADVLDQTYTGSAITPEPLVQTGSLSLTKGTDYTYSYTNNTNVGTATVTVTFKGDYASLGSVEKTFSIVYHAVDLADNGDNTDAISNIITNYGSKADVTLQDRTLYKDGNWNTLCLPFDVTISGSVLDGDGVVAKVFDESSTLDDAGLLTLKFIDAPATITAGTPFIIKWTSGSSIVNPVFEGVTISTMAAQEVTSTDGKVKFVGQYSPFAITDANINEILYVASGNKIGYSSKTRNLKSCRAHFWVQPNGGGAGARSIDMDFGDGETTSVNEELKMKNEEFAAAQWYTLDGVRLSGKPSSKGIYINNGKKIIIK
ncbi:MAG: hypothetical protein IJ548_08765 [Paludibacteraceae bacterium]|nr:hypothetical protein [Paludibacteraceae bacterium]MBQ8713644.1 hypothetical protein [Prevotella sp.]